ncbi:hypothetical protein OR1_04063 [Geobacter sp. OR-1]|nr:hypothetical protein OR1_04063 [Geobacter sp. OR-1]
MRVEMRCGKEADDNKGHGNRANTKCPYVRAVAVVSARQGSFYKPVQVSFHATLLFKDPHNPCL